MRKLFIIFIGIILIDSLIIMPGCGKKPGESQYRYYRVVDFAQICRVVPKYPIEVQNLTKGAFWQLKYDQRGRLKTVAYIQQGHLCYNEENQLARIDFEYSRGKEKQTIIDEYGRPINPVPHSIYCRVGQLEFQHPILNRR